MNIFLRPRRKMKELSILDALSALLTNGNFTGF
jgi:hypothetical protein